MHYLSRKRTIAHVVSAVAMLALAAGCSRHGAQIPAGKELAAPAGAVTVAKGASRLGDLGPFQAIALQVGNLVDQGDLPAAKARIKELELAWDGAEAGLKPRAADDWHLLDKAIDRALSALRTDAPKQADCKTAMAALLGTFISLQGKG